MKNGLVESLRVAHRCGVNKAYLMRTIALCDRAAASARPRLLQWVAPLGLVSRISVMTSSTFASVVVR